MTHNQSTAKDSLHSRSPVSILVQHLNSTIELTKLHWASPVESYVTTYCQSASLSWNKAPIWSVRPDFYYCQTVAGLLMWSALSDERTDLLFTIAAGSCQRNHFRVRVPWDSRPYFIVSDLRLPFLSPLMNRRATVEVFNPASTREGVLTCPPFITSGEPNRDHRLQQFLYYCVLIRWCGNVSSEPVSSNGCLYCASLTAHFRRSGVMSHCSLLKAVRPE
jgi:hypothetical protein